MNEPISYSFEVPAGTSTDLQLMTIWSQSYETMFNELTEPEAIAAANWFSSYLAGRIKRDFTNPCEFIGDEGIKS